MRSSGPPKPRSLNNFEVLSRPRKMLPSMYFDKSYSTCGFTASEVAEADDKFQAPSFKTVDLYGIDTEVQTAFEVRWTLLLFL